MTTLLTEPTRSRPTATASEDETISRHFLRRGHGAEFEMEADWVRAHLPPGAGRVVDLGCGIGSLFDAIGTSRAIGVDHQPSGLPHTRSRFPLVPLVCGGAERLPFADASLDGLTLQHVVEHLAETRRVFRELHRVLRPGGVLLLLTPNAEFCDPSVFEDPTHVHIFNRRDLPNGLRDVGFDIVNLRTIGLPWFRGYGSVPSAWRLRRFVTQHAIALSMVPPWRWSGQTLCCAARRPIQ